MSYNKKTLPLDLPWDIIFDILSRLPIKTLIRFKSVCKAWYALIEDPNFIKKHKIQSSVELDPTFSTMLVTSHGPRDRKNCRLLHYDEVSRKPILSELPYLSNLESCSVVGICDGLVCVSVGFGRSKLIICNPTTGHIQQVPPFKLEIGENGLVFLGFGLHGNGCELRRIIYTPPWIGDSAVVSAELYNMGTDIWTTIEVKLGKDHSLGAFLIHECSHQVAMVIGDILYWQVEGYNDNGYIVLFDIRKEELDIINVPYEGVGWDWQLLTIEGKLGVMRSHIVHDCFIKLWVLNEDMTWTMMCVYGDLESHQSKWEGGIEVLGSTRKRELILLNRDKNSLKLLLLNFDSLEITFIRDVDEGDLHTEFVYLYTESLALLN